MSCRHTRDCRSCSNAARVRGCSMNTAARTWILSRASALRRWATGTLDSRAPSARRAARWRPHAEQAATLAHTSTLYFHPLQGELASRLSALTGLDRAFFCNSGTEAVEACLKFARRYWHSRGATARTKYVAFTHSFHGRTLGSLSVTRDEDDRAPLAPRLPGCSL